MTPHKLRVDEKLLQELKLEKSDVVELFNVVDKIPGLHSLFELTLEKVGTRGAYRDSQYKFQYTSLFDIWALRLAFNDLPEENWLPEQMKQKPFSLVRNNIPLATIEDTAKSTESGLFYFTFEYYKKALVIMAFDKETKRATLFIHLTDKIYLQTLISISQPAMQRFISLMKDEELRDFLYVLLERNKLSVLLQE